jgi:hypothetical protein
MVKGKTKKPKTKSEEPNPDALPRDSSQGA